MYDAPHQFEPLLPSLAKQEPLLAKAHDLARSATQLAGFPIAPGLRLMPMALEDVAKYSQSVNR